MGLDRKSLLPEFQRIYDSIENPLEVDVIELGDQDVNTNDDPTGKIHPPMSFKTIYINKFRSWRTIDLVGTPPVEHIDLSVIINKKNCADIINNYGTSEHVEMEEGQYNFWVNMHNMLRVDGLSIHGIPVAGSWPGHCRWYYTPAFFKNFENHGYIIIKSEITWHNLIHCVLRKIKDVPFMAYNEFMNNVTFVKGKIPIQSNPKGLQ